MVLVKLSLKGIQVLNIEHRVLEITHSTPESFCAFRWWPIWTVDKDCLCWSKLFELFESEILPLKVHEFLKQFNFVLAKDHAS